MSALDRDPGDAVTREAGPRGSAYAVEHVTCLGCGCACDDIRVVVRDGRIVRAEQACPLGATWFGDGVVPGRASVGGHASALEPALDRAAALLAGAARPLVYVAPALSCEAQRAAVAVADLLAARLDSVTSATVGVATLAAQRRGRAGATLGEVRNRADLVVFWAVDPDVRYPRFTERYAPLPAGLAVPAGRGSRTVVAVDVGAACGYAAADARLAVAAEDEGGAIAAARAALLDGTRAAALLPADAPWLAPAQELARRIAAARYVAIVYDGEAPDAGSRAEGLMALAQAANGPTRCALVALRAGGNRSGAEAVFTWQTGFPMAVDFAQGAPRYEAGREHAVAALATHDVVLLVGDSAGVPAAVADALAHVPCVAVGPFASEIAPTAEVAVDVGLPGVHEGGTALRLDDVPLPLRAVLPGAAPDAVAVLAALTARLRAQRQGRAAAAARRAQRAGGREGRVTGPASGRLRIVGGAVHDPANGVDGEVRDVCVADGRIVASLPPDAPTLDARGMVVMAGGVDIHAHVASSAVNHGRRLVPASAAGDPARAPDLAAGEPLARSGSGGVLPSTFTTGYRYAGLGYTTAFDAAVAPVMARLTHAELDDTPIVDAGAFILAGNDELLFRFIDAGERERAREYAAWLLGAAGGYALKIVNPGGVARWKGGGRNVTALDDAVGSSRVTPRAILECLVGAADELGLPHPAHVHANNLGVPGNVETTLASMRAVAGRRCHFTHLQFHSYGGALGGAWRSGAREAIEYVNAHPEVSCDVGQVMFGPAVTITADAPVEYLLHKSSGRRWTNIDVELETGCGIVPYEYKERAAVAALQWAVGLELFLLSADPWRVVLSTDHPNGGTFHSYPELIRLLMDRAYRDDQLKRVNPKLLAGSALADGLAREYTLNEVAVVTRAGPARLLGLSRKGHLGVGADADVTVYARSANQAEMFSTPRYVLKGGTLVVEEGTLRRAPVGGRLHVRPAYDRGVEREVRRFFDDYGTVRFENYAVGALRDAPQAVERGGAAGPTPASSPPAAAGGPPHRDDRAGAPDARHRNVAPRGDRAPGAPPSGGGR